MKNIVLIGASGHAKVVIDIIERQGLYKIVGLIDTHKEKGHKICGYSILGSEEDIPSLIETKDLHDGIITIGDNYTRMKMYEKIESYNVNFNFVTAIHPNAVIGKNVKIGKGSCIMPGAVVNCDAKIGMQCIINTNSSVGHDTIINDFSSIAPGVTLGGFVFINCCSAISIGATVLNGISIGNNSVIGAGALVNSDIEDNKLAYGIPIKVVRSRNDNTPYL